MRGKLQIVLAGCRCCQKRLLSGPTMDVAGVFEIVERWGMHIHIKLAMAWKVSCER